MISKSKGIKEAIFSIKENLNAHKNKCIKLEEEIKRNEEKLKSCRNKQKDQISELWLLKKEIIDFHGKFCALEMVELKFEAGNKGFAGQNCHESMSQLKMRVLLDNEKQR